MAVVVLLAACGVTEPDEPSFSFMIRRVETIDYNRPRLEVSGGDGRIVAEGETWTGCTNGTIAGSLMRPSDHSLALVITDVQETDACLGAVTPYDYQGIIGDLERGRYHLQILLRHSRGDTPPRTVFHDFVHVH